MCTKRLRAIAFAWLATVALGGCFLADNDEADPIVPDTALAYPLKEGRAQQCKVEDDGQSKCEKAQIDRREDGGHDLFTWSSGGDGEQSTSSAKGYRLRKLSGEGVPADTYLAQAIAGDAGSRYLGLLRRVEKGGWEQLEPQCDTLPAQRFVEFMQQGWIFTTPDAKLSDVTCYISRDGLTDARLYAILSAPKGTSSTIIHDGK
ncbi:MAG: hypothetical protein KDE63_10510 [Novosphingobium sp.]|nr:hypothetical protein [Novosphingobium sp.]